MEHKQQERRRQESQKAHLHVQRKHKQSKHNGGYWLLTVRTLNACAIPVYTGGGVGWGGGRNNTSISASEKTFKLTNINEEFVKKP